MVSLDKNDLIGVISLVLQDIDRNLIHWMKYVLLAMGTTVTSVIPTEFVFSWKHMMGIEIKMKMIPII